MKKRVAILAGNYKEFMEFCKVIKEDEEFVYIDRPEKCIASSFDYYKIVGTFFETTKDPFLLEKEVVSRLIIHNTRPKKT